MKKAVVVGAGIVGLASARALAKANYKVTVIERNEKAQGASVRNFGMVWPVGQPPGKFLDLALRSRKIWLGVGQATGIFMDPVGSLHLAYREDELKVLKEFYTVNKESDYQLEWVDPESLNRYSKAAVSEGFRGGIYSKTEVIVDARQAIAEIPSYLNEQYGVEFKFNTTVFKVSNNGVETSKGFVAADEVMICSGADFESLFPEVYKRTAVTKCKLQMMRTPPQPGEWRLGPAIAGGLTLTHYKAFENCPTLPELKERFRIESPHFEEWGIHVMASQNGLGEIVIGDTHEYGNTPSPFDKQEPNNYILDYLENMCEMPYLKISESWHGIYAKMTDGTNYFTEKVDDHITILNGLGGAGMTLSFAVAEDVVGSLDKVPSMQTYN